MNIALRISNEGQYLGVQIGLLYEEMLLTQHSVNWIVYCVSLKNFREESIALYRKILKN